MTLWHITYAQANIRTKHNTLVIIKWSVTTTSVTLKSLTPASKRIRSVWCHCKHWPFWVRASTIPSASGSSGPITTRLMSFCRHHSPSASWSFTLSAAIHNHWWRNTTDERLTVVPGFSNKTNRSTAMKITHHMTIKNINSEIFGSTNYNYRVYNYVGMIRFNVIMPYITYILNTLFCFKYSCSVNKNTILK